MNVFFIFLPKYPKLHKDSWVYDLKIVLMLESSFLSQSEYSAPSSACPSGQRVSCSYACTVGWLNLLQPVAQFPSGKAGVFSDWGWKPAGDVFCFVKECFLLWGSALLLAWVECRGFAVHLVTACARMSPPTAYAVFCSTREWPHFSAVLWISCGPHPVGSAIQMSFIFFYPFCFFPCIPFLLQLCLLSILLASPLLTSKLSTSFHKCLWNLV